jgi:hypothetical protein
MRSVLAVLAFLGLVPFNVVDAQEATQIRYVEPAEVPSAETTIKTFGYVSVSGPITLSAVPTLAAALLHAEQNATTHTDGRDPIVYVVVSSLGGDIRAAMDMGRILRHAAARIWVDRDSECSSACVLLLAGGVVRYDMAGARVGLHRPYFPPSEFAGLSHAAAQQRYNQLLASVRAYLEEMGIHDTIFQAMVSVPSQDVRYIDATTADEARLFGEDAAYAEWQRARALVRVGEQRVIAWEQFRNCYNARLSEDSEDTCFSYLDHR